MNPVLQQLQPKKISPQIVEQAKRMMNEPQIQMLKLMIGKQDPKALFYSKCNEMGVNPEDILSIIR